MSKGELTALLLGAAISIVSTAVFDALRARRQDQKDREARDREERQAARVVLDELADVAVSCVAAIQTSTWWPLTDPLPTIRWEQFGPQLANATFDDTQAWDWISSAYQDIRGLNAEREAAQSHAFIEYGPESEKRVRRLLEEVNDAMNALHRFLGMTEVHIEPEFPGT